MEAAHDTTFIRELIIILTIAGIVVPLFHRFRVSPIICYLLTGIVIGPFGLTLLVHEDNWWNMAVISDPDWVERIAEFGVMLLLFMIGLELSVTRLWELRRKVFGLGGLQIILTAGIISAIAYGFGNGLQLSILIGACLSLSSTATVMQLLKERNRLGTRVGTTSFSILLMQDLAVVPILILLTVFANDTGASITVDILEALAKAVLAMALIFFLGRVILRPLLQYLGSSGSSDRFMAMILLIVVSAAALTAEAGLSMALGAFLAGLLISETEYRHEVEVIIDPLKSVFMGIFFLSVGMMIDIRQIFANPYWLIVSVVGIFFIKSVIITLLCRLFHLTLPQSVETGLLLGQGGEFAFLIVGMALTHQMIGMEDGQFFLLVAALTMLMTPFVATGAAWLRKQLEQVMTDAPDWVSGQAHDMREDHVVIIGFGRVGKKLGSVLEDICIPYIAIDIDSRAVGRWRSKGYPVIYGDARRKNLLNKLNIENARAVLITVDDSKSAAALLHTVRSICPLIPVIVRARETSDAQKLYDMGATLVVSEALEASLQLARHLLQSLGISEGDISHAITRQRDSISPPASA